MIEVHEYRCEYCGEAFDDEDECLEHEREHILEEIQPYIRCYNSAGRPIELSLSNLEITYYISWTKNYAIVKFLELNEEYLGFCYYPDHFLDMDAGQAWCDEDGHWHDVAEKIKELRDLLEIFNR